jgi:small-conductance mechanosensitive channel
MLRLIAQTTKISLLIFGFITALGTLGLNVSALVAGLGLTGFALGFALRDALSNLLAGILILFYRPFRRSDWISVAGVEGKVVGIDLRYTTLESDDRTFLIPNSTLFTNAITLFKATPSRPVLTPSGNTNLSKEAAIQARVEDAAADRRRSLP